jgi:hypothetical protein
MMIERNGFSLEKLTDQPNVQIPLLVRGAFLMHHSKLKEKTIWEIYEVQTDKTGLLQALATMYQETVTSLVGNEDEEVDFGKALEGTNEIMIYEKKTQRMFKKALKLTGFFLENHVSKTLDCTIPAVRNRLIAILNDGENS